MSYVVNVWESPVPTDLDSATDILSKYSDESTPQNPKYLQFAAALKALSDEHLAADPDNELPWVYGVPDGRCEYAVWNVQVETSAIALALRMLVKAARPLGLTIYDEQAAALWLPDGRVIGDPGIDEVPASPPSGAPIPLRSKTKVYGAIHDSLKGLLHPLGWTSDRKRAHFGRDDGAVRFEFSLSGTERPPRFELALFPSIIPRLSEPWQALMTEWSSGASVLFDDLLAEAGLELPGEPVNGFVRSVRIRDEAGLSKLTAALPAVVEKVLLPVFRSCDSLERLERRLNPMPGEPRIFFASYLGPIMAAALGNPRADEVMRELIELRQAKWGPEKLLRLKSEIAQVRAGTPEQS
jgi:hypothetical protein